MNPISSSSHSDFQEKVLASTPLDQDTVRIVGEYSDEDVETLASIISKETLEKIFDPPKEMKREGLIGRLANKNATNSESISALIGLISEAKIRRGEKFIEMCKGFKNVKGEFLELLSKVLYGEKKRTFSEGVLMWIDFSNSAISEQLVLHLIESASQSSSEKEKQETIDERGRLSKFSEKSPQIKNALNILKFKDKIDIEKELSKESIGLIKKILFENPNFAAILIHLIPQDKLSSCVSTLLNADFSGSKRVDPYFIKTKLLIAALKFHPELRIDLPTDWLKNVSLEGRIPASGLFERTRKTETLGDLLFDIDLQLCEALIRGSSENGRIQKYIEKQGLMDKDKIQKKNETLRQLAKEMADLKDKNFITPDGFESKNDVMSAIRTLMDGMKSPEGKAVDKDDSKKDS